MTYRTKLFPWCIIRHLPNMRSRLIARFRRRRDAESHLRILQQLLPTTAHTIIFDITPDTNSR